MSVVVIAIVTISLLSVLIIRKTEHRKSDQLLLLLCETGDRNLDFYFSSVQKSVGKVVSYVEADIDGLDEEKLSTHVGRVRTYFDEVACKTNGVLTYYYRIDPAVSTTEKGFWYIDLDGNGFVEHEVTDITQYDTQDTTKLVWFTVPKYKKEAIWLPPYITDNLNKRVISYNAPIYWRGNFVGVVGIEIDYSTMAEQVDSIRLFNDGYAFLNDSNGDLFYHPRIDVSKLTEETKPDVPEGVLSESTFIKYTFDGVKREAAWLPLSNGMRINVTVPEAELEGEWKELIISIIIGAIVVLVASSTFILLYATRISKPLAQLTEAAERADRGDYDFDLGYDKNDELGVLTRTFKKLATHMRDNLNKLNRQVFVDALTHVKNKAAFAAATDELQAQIDKGNGGIAFGIGVFDCDDLKMVNDCCGHEKGDVYLKTAGHAICGVFIHSPVFRIGGDEFAVILQNDDYNNRDALVKQFENAAERINSTTDNIWEQVHVAMGIAEYDPENDHAVSDVVRRADKNMYENKRKRKKAKNATSPK